jgi:hypothetical protein
MKWWKEKWHRFKRWVTAIFVGGTVIASGFVGVTVVDDNANPYTETATHFEMAVPEQVPEQGAQKVMFAKDRAEMRMEKWSGEVRMVVRYESVQGKGNRPLMSKNVEWQGQNEKVRGYRIDDENYEFEVELASKPVTNKFDFVIEGVHNLDFFYQPELTQEEIDEGAERPENVVGSYAVYHKTKANHRVGSTNYATGKAFHWYRPLVEDADGNTTWGELSWNEQTSTMTTTIPQEFLDNAKYPVIF